MKKKFIMIFAISLGLSGILKAQSAASTTENVRFGIKAGGNLTTLGVLKSGNQEFDYNHKFGLTAGLFAQIPLGGNFSFVPEVNYSQKGADVEGTIAGTTGKLEQRINYLDVPVAFNYKFAPGINLFAGPQVSFFLNQKTKTFVNGQNIDESTDSKDIEKTIAGGLIGLGYDITPNVNISGRYMSDFQKSSSNDDPAFEDIKNSGFSLTIGYKF
ncbi:hypothetical protein A5893_10270 [Pedobacter psychrophilus]|uniref:Outer membrane protein beta-barrel domain-containing protein n=1 Tax=Pedobacter psychrophilus TaxID=1826909 RepID=A0A179DDS6_9SPHI|nr:porin family protein [Pedobacter psychrophilus]OAQ39054.1 hypothetical protein A5893_10270 [Pedobacter psychrophilus]